MFNSTLITSAANTTKMAGLLDNYLYLNKRGLSLNKSLVSESCYWKQTLVDH